MTIQEAFRVWQETFQPEIPEDDGPMLSESWNNYTDSLCKDGELTDLQYHHCPAYDDPMPDDEDEEREYLLDQMGVRMSYETAALREGWQEGAKHYRCTLTRGTNGATFSTPYSMGPALSGGPTREDVLNCLLSDAGSIWDGAETFEEWADEMGEDSDSRKAEASYNACKTVAEELAHMFSDVSTDDMRAMFADY
ncbi:MAG: hypothetical protein JXQ91_07640 [Vannielia sp.]|uniref:hypothetical protein n=1 Tax=Vannielia sp. TaxID=2813045 RepID=UPI003B8B7697